MKTFVTFTLILAGGLALAPERAEACDPTPLPVANCDVDTTCCMAGVWEDQPGDDLCDEAMFFALLAPQCPEDYGAHLSIYNMDESSFEDHGLGECNGDLEFTKHWLATLLARGGIDWSNPDTRHDESDWAWVIQAQATSFHVLQEHFLDLDTSALGHNTPACIPDAIGFGCRAFEPRRSDGMRAGLMVHESWHSTVGGHAIDHDVGHDRDYFYAHHDSPDTPLWATFTTPEELWPMKDVEWTETHHSVYQLEYELLCELVEAPAMWVPRSVLFAAASEAADLLDENFIQHPVPVPAWAICDAPMPLGGAAGGPKRERIVTIRIAGQITETSVASIDDDNAEFEVILPEVTLDLQNPSHEFPLMELANVADGEIWIEFEGKLQLAADGETIELAYNVLFNEDDEDDTDCDEDLGGDDCPAKGNPALWSVVTLDSLTPPTTQFITLSNASNENGDDSAKIEMDFAGSF